MIIDEVVCQGLFPTLGDFPSVCGVQLLLRGQFHELSSNNKLSFEVLYDASFNRRVPIIFLRYCAPKTFQ